MTCGRGTYLYMAPEQDDSEIYDYRADIYSFGLIIFEVIYPFKDTNERSLCFHDLKSIQKLPSLLRDSYTHSDMCDMILKIVSEEPDMRPSILEIKETLNLWSQNNS